LSTFFIYIIYKALCFYGGEEYTASLCTYKERSAFSILLVSHLLELFGRTLGDITKEVINKLHIADLDRGYEKGQYFSLVYNVFVTRSSSIFLSSVVHYHFWVAVSRRICFKSVLTLRGADISAIFQ
jgi:hypothetical protein